MFYGGARHELRDALGALAGIGQWPDLVRAKAAFHPDQSSEEIDRQRVRPRRRLDHEANRAVGIRGLPGWQPLCRRVERLGKDHERQCNDDTKPTHIVLLCLWKPTVI